jgi:hypothetical protein
MTNLMIRGFAGGRLVFAEPASFAAGELDRVIPALVSGHKNRLPAKHMIEIEFLDEPDVNQRFFRIGTDPSGMVVPIAVLPKE